MAATPIRRIYEMPDHPSYGPVRRMWVMLEQLFADRGGVKALEVALQARGFATGITRPTWDAHLANLMANFVPECAAHRLVMQQLLIAAEIVL